MCHSEGVCCEEGDCRGEEIGLCAHEVSETCLLCTHLILVVCAVCEEREMCEGVVDGMCGVCGEGDV